MNDTAAGASIIVAAIVAIIVGVGVAWLVFRATKDNPKILLPAIVAGLTALIILVAAAEDQENVAAFLGLAGAGMGALAGAVTGLYGGDRAENPPEPEKGGSEPPASDEEGA